MLSKIIQQSLFAIFIITFIHCNPSRADTTPGNSTLEDESNSLRKLRQELILTRQYDRISRPVKNHQTITKVDMRITINEFVDLDTLNSMLITDAWFHISWRDEFLTWDPNDYSGLKQIHMGSHEIWRPDIVLINSADQENMVNVFAESDIVVNATGEVIWITTGLLHSKCPVWAYDYPFAVRPLTCQLSFCSLIYQSHEVNITTPGNEFFLAGPWMSNPKLLVMNISGERYEKFYDGYGTYSFETLNVKLRRRSNALPLIIRIPTLASITLILCMFFLPVTWPIRIHLGLFSILIQLLLILYIGIQMGVNAVGLVRPISMLRDDLSLASIAIVITLIFRRLLVLADELPALPSLLSSILQMPFAKLLCFGLNESEYKQHTYSHNLASAANDSSIIKNRPAPSRGFSIDHVALINEDSEPSDLVETSSPIAKQQQSAIQSSSPVCINVGSDVGPVINVPIISYSQREWMLLIIFADRILFVFYAFSMLPRLM